MADYFEELRPAQPIGAPQRGVIPPPTPPVLPPGTGFVPGPARPVHPLRRARRPRRSALPARRALLVAGGILAALALAATVAGNRYLNSVAGFDPNAQPMLARSIVIYDRDGGVLAERNQQGIYHINVRLADMGRYAPAATLAAEDGGFYDHGALNALAIARAVVVDTVNRRPVEGASTITQQLVKIEIQSSQKTLSRKIREALIANELENHYTKDQILEAYLNRAYYGHGAYGIGAAVKTYFGAEKQVRDLSPAQAAFLAGLLQAPSTNDPQLHFDRARAKELYALGQMTSIRRPGALTKAEAEAAAKEDIQKELKFDTSYRTTRAPHFVDYIISRLEGQFGAAAVQQGGLAVHTTLDPNLQASAERAVLEGVQHMAATGVNNGMMLAARPDTGEILAWVGSVDYRNDGIGGQFDVVLSPRQPGSSFKPYVYEAALKDHKITLASCLADQPTDFNGYRPLDFDNSYMGDISARTALTQSRNVPAVQVAQREGIQNVINLAAAMGVKSKLDPTLPTAIGGSDVTMLEHLQGYQVFAEDGYKLPLYTIASITDAGGTTVFEQKPREQAGRGPVLSSQESYLVTDVLKNYQNAWNLGFNRQMASKSGTSGASQIGVHQDAWMMAYNHDIVVGAWAGNTHPGGGGAPISAFGVNTGQDMLGPFINRLPAAWNHWYNQPAGLVSKGGELFLPGTEAMPTGCARPDGIPAQIPGGGDHKKHDGGGGGGGGDGGDGG